MRAAVDPAGHLLLDTTINQSQEHSAFCFFLLHSQIDVYMYHESGNSPGCCSGSKSGCKLSCDSTEQTGSIWPVLPAGEEHLYFCLYQSFFSFYKSLMHSLTVHKELLYYIRTKSGNLWRAVGQTQCVHFTPRFRNIWRTKEMQNWFELRKCFGFYDSKPGIFQLWTK